MVRGKLFIYRIGMKNNAKHDERKTNKLNKHEFDITLYIGGIYQ